MSAFRHRFWKKKRYVKNLSDEEESEEKPPQTPPPPAVARSAPSKPPSSASRVQKSERLARKGDPNIAHDHAMLSSRMIDETDASASERKRRSIRLKYGIREKDQEFYRAKEDEEEFENVDAVARPAATKMRTAKLRWKQKEKVKEEKDPCEVSARGADKGEKSFAELSEETVDDNSQSQSGNFESRERIADIKRRAGCIKDEQSKGSDMSTTDLRILLIRIEELELANRKLKLQMRKWKKQVREKEKKIEELTSINAFLQKTVAADQQEQQQQAQDEKPTPQQETVALRGLDIMQRNQLLEHTIHNQEKTMLCNFFEATEPKPTQTIVMLIDKALSYAIDVILMRPDLFDDFVDNELRIFLLDTAKAKRVLLDVMLLHPEYVPRAWGGDVLTKRQQQAKLEAEARKRAPVTEDKTIVEDESAPPPPQKDKAPVHLRPIAKPTPPAVAQAEAREKKPPAVEKHFKTAETVEMTAEKKAPVAKTTESKPEPAIPKKWSTPSAPVVSKPPPPPPAVHPPPAARKTMTALAPKPASTTKPTSTSEVRTKPSSDKAERVVKLKRKTAGRTRKSR